MTPQLTVETINPGSAETVIAWTCCARADGTPITHTVVESFLREQLPADIHFDCSFCGAPGPSLADLRAAAGMEG